MIIDRPAAGEYNPFYHDYIRRPPAGDLLQFMHDQWQQSLALLSTLSDEQASVRPAPGEWSIKEVIGHLCDGERVFSYRALRFARGDQAKLPGFEQDDYVATGNFNQRSLADLIAEFSAIRSASLLLFKSFSAEALMRTGIASDNLISVRALIYICAGHEHHHMESIRKVYLGMAE